MKYSNLNHYSLIVCDPFLELDIPVGLKISDITLPTEPTESITISPYFTCTFHFIVIFSIYFNQTEEQINTFDLEIAIELGLFVFDGKKITAPYELCIGFKVAPTQIGGKLVVSPSKGIQTSCVF
jgi:hypothetical protein